MKRVDGSQLELALPSSWGGRRAGAGRKRRVGLGRVAHRARAVHCGRHPVHVTLRSHLKSLRHQAVFPTVRLVIAGMKRHPDFRIVHFSVQHNHLHLLVEASDTAALSSGLRSLVIRLARQLNRLLMRRGAVWADRWHGHELTSPRAVRNALVYVLGNFRKHADVPAWRWDPFSSAAAFTGFVGLAGGQSDAGLPRAVGPPPRVRTSRQVEATREAVSTSATWLLSVGWKRHGLIGFHERPRS